jgi:hypothetical protein
MVSNPEEPNTQYAPLEERNNARENRPFNKKVLVALVGFCAVFALVLIANQSPAKMEDPTQAEDPDAIRMVDNRDLPQKQILKEYVAALSDFARISTVSDFNELIATKKVVDGKGAYGAMSAQQLEVLLQDFLSTMGSQVPDTEGVVPSPKKVYSTGNEHKHRLSVFQRNIQTILRQNSEEYARNPSGDRLRFGITIHADWEEEEFTNTRFNLKATNISELVKQAEVVPKKPIEFASRKNGTGFVSPRNLATCDLSPGGETCYIFSCTAYRHTKCYEHQCICDDGHCASQPAGICRPAPAPPPPIGFIKCDSHINGPTRQQGRCGDCWAFGTVQQLRYMTLQKYNQDPGTLSAQYLVDCMPAVQNRRCSDGVKGCCGGLPIDADEWLGKTGGLPTQAAYGPLLSDTHPFTRYPCKRGVPKKVEPSTGYNRYTDETDIANAYCDDGAVSIGIAANSNLMHYIGGVFDSTSCPPAGPNHAVIVVGVDRTFDSGKPVHIVLNSWGTHWGVSAGRPFKHVKGKQNGHVIFKFGENVCNIKALATSPKTIRML